MSQYQDEEDRHESEVPCRNLIGQVTAFEKERSNIYLDSPGHLFSHRVSG